MNPPKDITANTILDTLASFSYNNNSVPETDKSIAEASQQLAQALIAKMPDEQFTGKRFNNSLITLGYNQALSEVEQIIKDYFGASDEI